jgi:macrolide-specific efflux system membrane fusion protein
MYEKIKKRNWLSLLVLLLIGGGAGYAVQSYYIPVPKNPKYTLVEIRRDTIEDVVTAQGKLEPKEYVDVGAQVSGQLKKLHVEIGDSVKIGDLIAEIDAKVYESEVAGNEARLKTLKAQRAQNVAQVKQAKQKLDRNAQLIQSQAISREVFEDAETALKVAEAQLMSLNAQIEEAESTLEGNKANLNYTNIYAPMNGTVVVQSAREGQTLNANQTAPTLVQLANLDTMTVRAQVAEADITRLTTGIPVYFTTLGAGERRWQGSVRQILPSPQTVNDVVLYNVLVDVGNEDRQLMTGMSTQMFFTLGRAENVPVIPASSLNRQA